MVIPFHQIFYLSTRHDSVYLTKTEESMLDGGSGEGSQLAMKLLLDLGEFFEADKLIPISSTHISGVSYLTGGDGLLDQLELFVNTGATVSVYSTLNPCGMDRNRWKEMYIDLEFATKQFSILQYFKELKVLTTCSCTPYDFGHLLTKGQHVAWAESSAVTFANSYFGARTNKEDSLSVLAAAITGRTPNYGFHLTDERVPNVRVIVEAELKEYSDYSIAGEIVGRAFKAKNFPFGAIPQFSGSIFPRPQDFKALGAALASFGTQLFHIKGITPEQDLLHENFDDDIIITKEMLFETYEELAPQEDVNLVVIGCPNANIEEIQQVSQLVEGRELRDGMEFWVFTNAAQKSLAKQSGLIKVLEEAGVKIFVDTCPEVTKYDKSKFQSILTNSVKAQHYISAPSLNDLKTYLLPLKDCVEVAFQ